MIVPSACRKCTNQLCLGKKLMPKKLRISARASHAYKTNYTGLPISCRPTSARSLPAHYALVLALRNGYPLFLKPHGHLRYREFRARLHKLSGEVSEAMAGSGDKTGQSQVHMAALNASKQQVQCRRAGMARESLFVDSSRDDNVRNATGDGKSYQGDDGKVPAARI
jgi:hypothetical protein